MENNIPPPPCASSSVVERVTDNDEVGGSIPPSRTKTMKGDFSTRFLDETLEKTYTFAQHLDTQTNVLVGLSTAIFLFSMSRFISTTEELSFLVLGFFSGLSSLIGLFAIHPPKFMRKRGQEESLMYHKNIIKFSSPQEYYKKLRDMIDNRDSVMAEYATEIYNVSKYYYRPKRKLFHMARNMLIVGLLVSFFAFLIDLMQI